MSDQTALAVRPGAAPLIEWNQAQIALLSRTLVADAKLEPDELRLFIAVCKRTQLDPFLRQVYAIKSQGRLQIHVGIDGRRTVAHRTGQVNGTDGPYWCGDDEVWKDVWLSETAPAAAKFSVYRRGAAKPFTAVVRMKSFKGKSPVWSEKPDHMLAIRAEDHAWRRAFPYEMGGLPTYVPENEEERSDAEAAALEEWEKLQEQQRGQLNGHVDAESRELPPEEAPRAPREPDLPATRPMAPEATQEPAVMRAETEPPEDEAGEVAALFDDTELRGECKAIYSRMQRFTVFSAVRLPLDAAPESKWSEFLDVWGMKLGEAERAAERRAQGAGARAR